MAQSWGGWYWHFGLASLLAMGGAIATSGDCTLAQSNITPDSTLGSESSEVIPNFRSFPVEVINGGAQRGANLFHSFREFNVSEGRGAYFTNPAGIENILSRVTGGSRSDILGTLGVLGNANLFLINPNGIIFGPNASLNIGGSFLASTASSLNFADGTQFSATAPQTTPLLTVSVPLGLQFGGTTSGSILNQSQATNSNGEIVGGLQVKPGKTLALVGGDVRLDGGILFAPGGRVELGGVAGAGTVGLNGSGDNLSMTYPKQLQRADVSLTNGSLVFVAASGGGSIAFNARNVNLEETILRAGIKPNQGGVDAQAGDITINATEAIKVANNSMIDNRVESQAVGNGGDINITTGSLSVTDGAFLIANTRGHGNAGRVTIHAQNTVSFDKSFAYSSVEKSAVGNSGGINITTGSLFVTNGTGLVANTFGEGSGGDVTITARDTVSFDGVGSAQFTAVYSDVADRRAVGNGGSINITTESLTLRNGARLSTSTFGKGNAGNVTINARDTISFNGVVSIKNTNYPSGAFSNVEFRAVGNAGSINIKTGSLSVMKGAQVATTTRGQGDAGSVNITARDTVSFDGVDSIGNGNPSAAFSNVESGAVGNGGSINITTELLALTNGALLSASSIESDAAISMEFANRPNLMDNQASLISDTTAGQGNIILRSQNLVLRRGSKIFTNATGTATGGNITIDTGIIAALENSDISANALEARGGRVIIDAQGIFGTEFRQEPTSESDITASSRLGPQFSGTVEINTPDVDPSRGLVNLPAELVDVSGLVAQGCPGVRGNVGRGASEFIITGRGGLPPNPTEALRSDAVRVDLGTPVQGEENRALAAISSNSTSYEPTQIVEAQGWVIGANGEVMLTARPPTLTPHSPWMTAVDCHTPQNPS